MVNKILLDIDKYILGVLGNTEEWHSNKSNINLSRPNNIVLESHHTINLSIYRIYLNPNKFILFDLHFFLATFA